jgi:DNA mismatch endonuclease, patch repair protein
MDDSDSSVARIGSWASTPGIRSSMRSNRGRDTAPELAVRRRVHAMGLRYRTSVRPVPEIRRTADMVFTRIKVAVFIDGCYWHGCPEHYVAPVRNAEFWAVKRRRNRDRDEETDAALRVRGWAVLRIWEHEVGADADAAARRVVKVVKGKRSAEQ